MYYITEIVQDEIKKFLTSYVYNLVCGELNISIVEPFLEFVNQIKETARDMGQENLSNPDIEVLALALQFSKKENVLIITDDYGIKNVANQLSISTQGIKNTAGKQKRKYKFKCKGCSKIYKFTVNDCDICGSTNFQRLRR